jgi:hypothetical protein
MEQAVSDQVLVNLKKIFIGSIILIVLAVVILVLVTVGDSFTGFDADYFIGMSVLVTFGIVMPVVMIVLSFIGKANLNTKPQLIFGFSIGTVVILATIAFALCYGAVQILEGASSDVYWITNGSSAVAFDHSVGLAMTVTSGVTLLAMVPITVLIIITAVKNIKLGQPFVLQAMASSKASAAPRNMAAGSSSGSIFCTQCGAPNNRDAKFCNKCGQAL